MVGTLAKMRRLILVMQPGLGTVAQLWWWLPQTSRRNSALGTSRTSSVQFSLSPSSCPNNYYLEVFSLSSSAFPGFDCGHIFNSRVSTWSGCKFYAEQTNVAMHENGERREDASKHKCTQSNGQRLRYIRGVSNRVTRVDNTGSHSCKCLHYVNLDAIKTSEWVSLQTAVVTLHWP